MIAWIDQDKTDTTNYYASSYLYTVDSSQCHIFKAERVQERIANDLKSKEQVLFLSRQRHKPISQFNNQPIINMKKLFSISGYLPRKIRSKYKHT